MGERATNSEFVINAIKDFTECKPKGGERLAKRIGEALLSRKVQLFVPWAAPANGRTQLFESEVKTIDWLCGSNGLKAMLNEFFDVNCLVMFADTYARRNNFDITKASRYWSNISDLTKVDDSIVFTATSLLEDESMQQLRAREAYAFEKLEPKQRRKILTAAEKYSGGSNPLDVYESAAQYSMLRAAEASYVDETIGALWVSLNWPERDIMCGNVPRIYIPEGLRAPWLKGE